MDRGTATPSDEIRGAEALMWVRGHEGIVGSDIADYRAKGAVIRGQVVHKPSIATPAGIRQAYKAPAHACTSANGANRSCGVWST